MAPLVADRDFSGVVLIGTPDAVLFSKAYGEADLALGRPNTLDSRFRVASITKTFTAAAISLLADLELLALDDTVDEYVPEFPGGSRITLQDLLLHRSGLANPDYAEQFTRSLSLPELVQHIGERPVLFAPGERSQYSSAGYNLLALVIERVTEQPYEQALQDLLFEPLEMRATEQVPDLAKDARHAAGYVPGPPPEHLSPIRPYDLGFYTGSGSFSSTAGDLYRWARAIHAGVPLDLRTQPYPFGWGLLEQGGVSQTGAVSGFASTIAIFDDPALFVITLQNVSHAAWTRWAADLASIARGEEFAPPERRRRAELTGSLAPYVGRYAAEQNEVAVVGGEGHLWLHWNGWEVPAYLTPIEGGRFEALEYGGTLEFGAVRSDVHTSFVWRFGADDPGTTYARITEEK